MLLGGLWHGAGWTFVIWGGLHGVYLVINHAWHGLREHLGYPAGNISRTGRITGMMITFPAIVLAWVFFRAPNFHTAMSMINSMIGFNGIMLPGRSLFNGNQIEAMARLGIHFGPVPLFYGYESIWTWIAVLWAMAWLAPNSQQILLTSQPTLEQADTRRRLRWYPNKIWLSIIAVFLLYSIIKMEKVSEFLYFQF